MKHIFGNDNDIKYKWKKIASVDNKQPSKLHAIYCLGNTYH